MSYQSFDPTVAFPISVDTLAGYSSSPAVEGLVREVLDSSHLQPLSAIAWRTNPGWFVRPRHFPFCYLWVVLEGTVTGRIEGMDQQFRAQPGDLFVIPEDAEHEIRSDSGAPVRHVVFHFLFRFHGAIDILSLLNMRGRLEAVHPEDVVRNIARELCAAYGERSVAWSPYVASGLYYLLYPSILRAAAASQESVSQVIGARSSLGRLMPAFAYVRRNLERSELTITDVANAANISEVYLRRLFRLHLGKSPRQFLLEERINRARDLLLHTDYTIDRVARMSGFDSPSYFHRCFRTRFLASPNVYRRSRHPGQLRATVAEHRDPSDDYTESAVCQGPTLPRPL